MKKCKDKFMVKDIYTVTYKISNSIDPHFQTNIIEIITVLKTNFRRFCLQKMGLFFQSFNVHMRHNKYLRLST